MKPCKVFLKVQFLNRFFRFSVRWIFYLEVLKNLPGVPLATEKHFYFKLTSGTQPSGALPAAPSEKTNSEKVSCCTTARCLAPQRRGDKDELTLFFFFFSYRKGNCKLESLEVFNSHLSFWCWHLIIKNSQAVFSFCFVFSSVQKEKKKKSSGNDPEDKWCHKECR